MKQRRSIVLDTSAEMKFADMKPGQAAPAAEAVVTHMTAMGFVKIFCTEGSVPFAEMSGHGRALSRLSRERGITIEKVPDPRFGQVNGYSVELMRTYFRSHLKD